MNDQYGLRRVRARKPLIHLILIFACWGADSPAEKASAITINIEYTDEGDPLPHDENPNWDPDGSILKDHFDAAKAIWEDLLPGPGDYQFDFHWDDDIGASTLGLATDLGVDSYIEINPNFSWFADPTPMSDEEFSPTAVQQLYSQLSSADRVTFFPSVNAPPGTLEVRFSLAGSAGLPGPAGFDSASGFDLLTVILHEMGHILGVDAIEPGEYNIDPQHIGGIVDVLVLEGDSGHLGGTSTTPGFLMNAATPLGRRYYPSATDVLVIAEDQGISDVHLARVDRITSGVWSASNGWVGGDVPDLTQDVSIRHGGAIALDADGQARNLLVAGGNSAAVGGRLLNVERVLSFDAAAATVTVGSGGAIAADSITGDPANLATTPGSLVKFNSFDPGESSATTANFNGSVTIGHGAGPSAPVTFDPSVLTAWTISEQLNIGDGQADATLVIDNGATFTAGAGRIGTFLEGGSAGHVSIQGPSSRWTTTGSLTARNGTLTVAATAVLQTGDAQLGADDGQMLAVLNFAPWTVAGNVDVGPSDLIGNGQGRLIVENLGVISVSGGLSVHGTSNLNSEVTLESSGKLEVEGDVTAGPFGVVTFTGNTRSGVNDFVVQSGRIWKTTPTPTAGAGGRIRFVETSRADFSSFRNDGWSETSFTFFVGGAGGATEFYDEASAVEADFDNLGTSFYYGGAKGGRTNFFDAASAERGDFTNYPGASIDGGGATNFYGESTAESAMISNKGGTPVLFSGGRTNFYDEASAGAATFVNEGTTGGLTQSQPYAGSTRFYGNSTAGAATFLQKRGGSTTEFNHNSSAASATFVMETSGSGFFGGAVIFNGNSRGGTAQFTIEPFSYGSSIAFGNNSTAAVDAPHAEQVQITLQDSSNGYVYFSEQAHAGEANIDIGSVGRLIVDGQATAANATIRLRPGAIAQFNGAATASDSTITVEGAVIAGGGVSGGWGSLNFAGASAGNAVITTEGGRYPGARGGNTAFDYAARGGNATLITNGPVVAGATGGVTTFGRAASGENARVITNAGGAFDVSGNRIHGVTQVGSIEGAGVYVLSGAELETGSRNTDTTVSGPIIDVPNVSLGGKLTKVGAGALTLAGTNTYTGLTKINAGALEVNGSIVGNVSVNSQGTLQGIGSVGGTVTVNAGGKLAPGSSAGKLSVGSLNMMPGAVLEIELGGTLPGSAYDQIQAEGSLSLGGTLELSLINGFSPAAGQAFDLFNSLSVAGGFDAISLPQLGNGLSWNASQFYATGVLSVVAGAFGDFDGNGNVDGHDFLAWQRNPALGNLGDWQANFGNGLVDAASAVVPEPKGWALMLIASMLGALSKGRRHL